MRRPIPDIFHVFLPGRPQAQPRHRVHRVKGRVHSYDPASKAKDSASRLVLMAVNRQSWEKIAASAVEVGIDVWYAPARKPTRAMRGAGKTTRPDVDNIAKFYLDVLTGIVFEDDACVLKLDISKDYAPEEIYREGVDIYVYRHVPSNP